MFKKSILARIVQWQRDRLILDHPFDHEKEITFIVEEVLESTGAYKSEEANQKAQEIVKRILAETKTSPTREEMVDSFGDIIVFATGAIAKLGYDPDKVMDEIHKEIDSRRGKIIDGKWVKDRTVKTYKADFTKCDLE